MINSTSSKYWQSENAKRKTIRGQLAYKDRTLCISISRTKIIWFRPFEREVCDTTTTVPLRTAVLIYLYSKPRMPGLKWTPCRLGGRNLDLLACGDSTTSSIWTCRHITTSIWTYGHLRSITLLRPFGRTDIWGTWNYFHLDVQSLQTLEECGFVEISRDGRSLTDTRTQCLSVHQVTFCLYSAEPRYLSLSTVHHQRATTRQEQVNT
jgi:hypothetical protein